MQRAWGNALNLGCPAYPPNARWTTSRQPALQPGPRQLSISLSRLHSPKKLAKPLDVLELPEILGAASARDGASNAPVLCDRMKQNDIAKPNQKRYVSLCFSFFFSPGYLLSIDTAPQLPPSSLLRFTPRHGRSSTTSPDGGSESSIRVSQPSLCFQTHGP